MTDTVPPGCLASLLRLKGIRLGEVEPQGPDRLPYRLRDDFLSPAELSFYHVLQLVVKDHAKVLTKVNLADVFFVAEPSQKQSTIATRSIESTSTSCCAIRRPCDLAAGSNWTILAMTGAIDRSGTSSSIKSFWWLGCL